MSAPHITSTDRLSLTIFLAIVMHALVILGVGFSASADAPRRAAPLIEITLADKPQELTPEDYDYLAQASQDGGGESLERERPRKPAPLQHDGDPDGLADSHAAPASAVPAPAEALRLISVRGAEAEPEQTSDSPTEQADLATPAPLEAPVQLARWAPPQEQRDSVLARFPVKRRIDARTKAHSAASYMLAWQEKVERVGNLNYPGEARRRNLAGNVIVEVTLRPDGSVYDLRVLQPSPHAVLDQAALRAVRLSAPFAPVSEEVLQGSDLLVITRTLEFLDERGLSTR